MLKIWSSSLSLVPTKIIPKNITEERIGFKVSEFVMEKTPMPVPPSKTPTYLEKGILSNVLTAVFEAYMATDRLHLGALLNLVILIITAYKR